MVLKRFVSIFPIGKGGLSNPYTWTWQHIHSVSPHLQAMSLPYYVTICIHGRNGDLGNLACQPLFCRSPTFPKKLSRHRKRTAPIICFFIFRLVRKKTWCSRGEEGLSLSHGLRYREVFRAAWRNFRIGAWRRLFGFRRKFDPTWQFSIQNSSDNANVELSAELQNLY